MRSLHFATFSLDRAVLKKTFQDGHLEREAGFKSIGLMVFRGWQVEPDVDGVRIGWCKFSVEYSAYGCNGVRGSAVNVWGRSEGGVVHVDWVGFVGVCGHGVWVVRSGGWCVDSCGCRVGVGARKGLYLLSTVCGLSCCFKIVLGMFVLLLWQCLA